jgi:hypothetical protein
VKGGLRELKAEIIETSTIPGMYTGDGHVFLSERVKNSLTDQNQRELELWRHQ